MARRWFPELQGLGDVHGRSHVIDGEVCILDDLGRSDFDRLHKRASHKSWYVGAPIVTFCVFDLLKLDGREIMDWGIEAHRAALATLLHPVPPNILIVTTFDPGTSIADVFRDYVVPLGLEGLVAKREGSIYQPGVRTRDWIKIKRRGAVPPERLSLRADV